MSDTFQAVALTPSSECTPALVPPVVAWVEKPPEGSHELRLIRSILTWSNISFLLGMRVGPNISPRLQALSISLVPFALRRSSPHNLPPPNNSLRKFSWTLYIEVSSNSSFSLPTPHSSSSHLLMSDCEYLYSDPYMHSPLPILCHHPLSYKSMSCLTFEVTSEWSPHSFLLIYFTNWKKCGYIVLKTTKTWRTLWISLSFVAGCSRLTDSSSHVFTISLKSDWTRPWDSFTRPCSFAPPTPPSCCVSPSQVP